MYKMHLNICLLASNNGIKIFEKMKFNGPHKTFLSCTHLTNYTDKNVRQINENLRSSDYKIVRALFNITSK